MIYQIITEDLNREVVMNILDSHFDGYTIAPVQRRWKRNTQPFLIITILWAAPEQLQQAAEEIKKANNQDVLTIVQWENDSITI